MTLKNDTQSFTISVFFNLHNYFSFFPTRDPCTHKHTQVRTHTQAHTLACRHTRTRVQDMTILEEGSLIILSYNVVFKIIP